MENEKRLIDANAPRAVFEKWFKNYLKAGEDRAAQDMEDVLWELDAQPTVDAVEVVHAEWLDGCAIHNGKEVYKSIDCSHCNEIFKIESYDREYWKKQFKVCPFCGARMDGGNEDD